MRHVCELVVARGAGRHASAAARRSGHGQGVPGPHDSPQLAVGTPPVLRIQLQPHERRDPGSGSPGTAPRARRTKNGRSLADGGTLLLDDVHELTLPAQAQLMRVLQQREFAMGAARDTGASAGAPHRHMRDQPRGRGHRGALPGRRLSPLSGFSIAVPPLRERRPTSRSWPTSSSRSSPATTASPPADFAPRARHADAIPMAGQRAGARQRDRTCGAVVRRRGGARPPPLARHPLGGRAGDGRRSSACRSRSTPTRRTCSSTPCAPPVGCAAARRGCCRPRTAFSTTRSASTPSTAGASRR